MVKLMRKISMSSKTMVIVGVSDKVFLEFLNLTTNLSKYVSYLKMLTILTTVWVEYMPLYWTLTPESITVWGDGTLYELTNSSLTVAPL